MADYTVKRDGLWRFVRRVPKEYAALDQRKIVQHSTGVRVADDPRGIRARKIADNLNAALEAHWRDLVENRNAQAVRNYEAARQAARRLRISEPIADAAQRTIAELLDRIERLERKRDDRAAVLAVYDAAPKPGITFRQCAERFIEAHKPGWSNPKHAGQWSATLATYAYPVIGDVAVDKIGLPTVTAPDLIMPRVLTPDLVHQDGNGVARPGPHRVHPRLGEGAGLSRRRESRSMEGASRQAPTSKGQGRAGQAPCRPPLRRRARLHGEASAPSRRGTAARALEFTILTALLGPLRVILAKWSEIDLKARMWTVKRRRA